MERGPLDRNVGNWGAYPAVSRHQGRSVDWLTTIRRRGKRPIRPRYQLPLTGPWKEPCSYERQLSCKYPYYARPSLHNTKTLEQITCICYRIKHQKHFTPLGCRLYIIYVHSSHGHHQFRFQDCASALDRRRRYQESASQTRLKQILMLWLSMLCHNVSLNPGHESW